MRMERISQITIPGDGIALDGILGLPEQPKGVIAFAHGSGSGRFSPRNQFVARVLETGGFATLLLDLLTPDEADDRSKVFDIDLLADRLLLAQGWLLSHARTKNLRAGYFGASTGAGAALQAAAREPDAVGAVVSRGGRPDLAGHADDVGPLHGAVLVRDEAELLQKPWLGPVQTTESMVEMSELWDALMVHGANEFPELVTEPQLELLRTLVPSMPQWWKRMEQMPRTLIHNDFNPRNLGLRREGLRLCAYDWELSTLHLPQHDLAELLCFVLNENIDQRALDHYLDLHRRTLMESSGRDIDAGCWRAGYRYALRDLCINRLMLYLMGHTVRRYSFMERVLHTARALLFNEMERTSRRQWAEDTAA